MKRLKIDLSEYGYTVCRGGEAGWDNSPRFDVNEEMDAIDFSMFQAHDSLYLSYIYEELGDMTKAAELLRERGIAKADDMVYSLNTSMLSVKVVDDIVTLVFSLACEVP